MDVDESEVALGGDCEGDRGYVWRSLALVRRVGPRHRTDSQPQGSVIPIAVIEQLRAASSQQAFSLRKVVWQRRRPGPRNGLPAYRQSAISSAHGVDG